MKSIILLSGGLDSLVSCGLLSDSIEVALTFDYGQKSLVHEISASKKICDYFNIEHKLIKLDFLKEITNTALVGGSDVPELNLSELGVDSAKSVWVPNRNSLFLNVAASYCDSLGYNQIIIGANKEEAKTFPDNTKEFIDRVNDVFEYSTQVHPKVVAPLINLNKNDIVKLALDKDMPLNLVHSCYNTNVKHCGKCESCQRLKRALIANNCENLIGDLFENEN